MSRRVAIRPVVAVGEKVGLLPEVAEEVVEELRAEGHIGVSFDAKTQQFVSEGQARVQVEYDGRVVSGGMKRAQEGHGQAVQEAERRYGLKLQKQRTEQVLAQAKKRGYTPKKHTTEDGKTKIVLVRRVYR